MTGEKEIRSAPGDPDEETSQDRWLDEVGGREKEQRRHPALAALGESFAVPLARTRRVFSFIATTPGRMVSITVLLSIAIIAAGFSMSQSAADRQQGLDLLLTNTEPMSYATHNLYTSLSTADTIATTGFVRAGVESDDSIRAYYLALEAASVAATRTAEGIEPEDDRLSDLITDIQRKLPIYSGMVESARVNSRLGNPVGVTYMANASAMMRGDILPAASELFSISSDRVGEEQHELSRPQFVPLSGLIAAAIFLGLAQWWLWRTTRRRFNRWFLLATGLIILSIGWVSISNLATWQAGTQGFDQAAQPWDSLTTSRIQAQQSRTTETLALVRRESVSQSTMSFNTTVQSVTEALDSYAKAPDADMELVEDARVALNDWSEANREFTEALDTGDYDTALYLSSGTTLEIGAEPTAANAYTRLDAALQEIIEDARSSMRTFISAGLSATSLVASAVMLLALFSVLAIWLGIRPRLQEYL